MSASTEEVETAAKELLKDDPELLQEYKEYLKRKRIKEEASKGPYGQSNSSTGS